MKTNTRLLSDAVYLMRMLLLLIMLTLSLSVWSNNYETVVHDGVTYYVGEAWSGIYRNQFIAIVKVGDDENSRMLPKQKEIHILSDVTINGKTCPVVGFGTELVFTRGENLYSSVLLDDEVVDNIYLTRISPIQLEYNAPHKKYVKGRIYPHAVVHVPDTVLDKIMEDKQEFEDKQECDYRITDGTRWYYNRTTYPVEMWNGDDGTYEISYPKDQSAYAVCTVSAVGDVNVHVLDVINDGYQDIPVTAVKVKGKVIVGEHTANIFVKKLVEITVEITNVYGRINIVIHVPAALYDAAVKKYGDTYFVTDGKRASKTPFSFTYDQNGFRYKTTCTNGIWTTVIIQLPDTEIVRIPETVECEGTTYMVTGLKVNSLGSNIKDIYFGRLLKDCNLTGINTSEITAHVPDSLFSSYANKLNVRCILSDRYRALNSNVFPYKSTSASSTFFDINGDGKLELFNACFSSRGLNKETHWIADIAAITSQGDTVYSVMKDVDQVPLEQRGYFSFLDCKGEPYWVDATGLIYNSSGDIVKNVAGGYPEISATNAVTTADFNGDGYKELIYGSLPSEGYADIQRMSSDGTFVNDKIYVTSDTTELEVVNDYTPNSGVITKTTGNGSNGIRGLGEGMFVKAKPNDIGWMDDESDESNSVTRDAKETVMHKRLVKDGNQLRIVSLPTGAISASDYNGDGLVDLNDGMSIYYNLGGNRFFRSPHQGTVYATDLTGNGQLDYIDFTSAQTDLYITQPDGSLGEPKTLLKNKAVQNVFFGDFDHDGDVDILFFITSADYTLFQFYRNDGNGVFRAKDDNVDGLYTAKACNDYDGDGLYEVLAYSESSHSYSLFKIGKTWNIKTIDLPNSVKGASWNDNYGFQTACDIDNDGFMEILSKQSSYIIFDKVQGAVGNTSPEKMTKPSAVAFPDANKLKISWMCGKDKETSSCDLTYELRIGTASGKGDVFYGNSNADGSRRVMADGNMGRALSYMYDTGNLPEGRYYIAVQAVDAGCRGGAWSDELVYDHKVTVPVMRKLAGGCTSDTLTLAVQNPSEIATYEWHLDKGSIISQNDNGSIAYAQFNEAGVHIFSVSMTIQGKTIHSDKETVFMTPSKAAFLPTNANYNVYGKNGMDMNQDGNVEIKTENSKFYECKSDATYSAIRKTWNTDLSGSLVFGDFNHDGYPDFLTYDYSTSKVFYNSGENDFSFDEEELNTGNISNAFRGSNAYWLDWNNDGKLASYGDYAWYVDQNGDFNYSKLENKDNDVFTRNMNRYYDFNRDGCMDIYDNTTDSQVGLDKTTVRLKVPGGDLLFEKGKTYYQNNHSYSMSGFADFNNDGNADGYFFDNGYMVIVKGKPLNQWPCTETVAIPIGYNGNVPVLLDVDNNGYLDIIYNGSVWLLDKDFEYTKTLSPHALAALRYSYESDFYDEHHWQPLTRGAYPNGLSSAIANEAPSVPTNVTVQNTASGLLLKWDDATDDHTPWAQMRYNVSLKIKGKTGAGAFVLSPMNGLSDDAAILPGVHYRKATQLTVPASALVEGTTYEVQVQAIDLMGEHSAMSNPVDIVFHKDNYIACEQTNLFTSTVANLSYVGTRSSDVVCDPGESGSIVSKDATQGTFEVKWSKPGLKTVTMTADGKTMTAAFNVSQMPSLTIDLPKQVMVNSELTVRVPDAFLHPALRNAMFCDQYGNQTDNCAVSYTSGDSTAVIVFTAPGKGYVNASVAVPGVSQRMADQSYTEVVDHSMPEAQIKSVESDGLYYRVNWATDVPSMVTNVEIARETNVYGQFEVQDVVPVSDGTWCDLSSDNRIQPRRYRIRLVASNNVQRSGWSVAHNPLHIDINKTSDGHGNNIMWNAYEGLNVESYVIMRGSAANKLQTIATVPANQLSYADMATPDGTCFYAVRFNEVQTLAKDGKLRAMRLEDNVQSNVVSSDEAMPTVAATGITVGTVEKVATLSQEQPQLHLTAVILPIFATYNKVGWRIVSGGEYATLASNGVLCATGGKGDVVVRATTLDGSALSAEIVIPCDYMVQAKAIGIYRPKPTLGKDESMQLKAILLPQNTSASNVVWSSEDPSIATVDEVGVVRGLAIGSTSIWARTKDGSDLATSTLVEVVPTLGITAITNDSDKDLEYYTVDGKKVSKPIKGQINVTNKGYKVLRK